MRDYDNALDEIERCLIHNSRNHKARALKAAILRKLGKSEEALAWIQESYKIDPFNYGCMVEEHLLTGSDEPLQRLITLMHGEVHNYYELALDYANARLFDEAGQVLTIAKRCPPLGARAPYLLGCLYYDKRQYDLAKENWELSAQRDAEFPTVWRNLALYYYNKEKNRDKALECMERAFHLDESDSRILMELDQLYKVTGRPHAERLAHLEQYPALIAERDDLLLEQITLLNHLARYDEAMALLDSHIFHPWEGGEGKVQGAQDNDFHYLLGCAYHLQGDEDKTREHWHVGTQGPAEPAAAMYYNDAKPDKIFYAALCYRRLGMEDKARGLFYKLVSYGEKHLFDEVKMDYFAVSLPDLQIWDGDLNAKNRLHCLFLLALGYTGLGDTERARCYADEVARLDVNHQGVQALRTLI